MSCSIDFMWKGRRDENCADCAAPKAPRGKNNKGCLNDGHYKLRENIDADLEEVNKCSDIAHISTTQHSVLTITITI